MSVIKSIEDAIMSSADRIVDNWDEWDGEARQAAQVDQDDRSWRLVMMTHIVRQMWQEFGLPERGE